MEYNNKNWNELLEALNFREIKNPNGYDCYDILSDREIPTWQYETEEKKRLLYVFFSGALYMKNHTKY